jgi:tRNA U34 5-methylaminomethyl-2-thiouridine-forming methyltransferase MnmC
MTLQMAESNRHASHDDDLEWRDGNVPVSRRFGDIYYSPDNGCGEAQYVFVEGNRLPQRWPDMPESTVGELGFGTGLNFLLTLQAWRALRAPEASLRFISFEAYPLSSSGLARAHSRWPGLEALSRELCSQWQQDSEMAILKFEPAAELVLFLCDAAERLPRLEFQADAWFLDGFAPAHNPLMWGSELLQAVYDRTVPGGTFATFTAAGWVRRNLEAAGFAVEKKPGFGRKREMLLGTRMT